MDFLNYRILISSSHQKGKKLCEAWAYSDLSQPQGVPLCSKVQRGARSFHAWWAYSWPQGLLEGFTQSYGPSAQKEQTHKLHNFREYPNPRWGFFALKRITGLHTLSQGKCYIYMYTTMWWWPFIFYLFYVSSAEDHYLNGPQMPYQRHTELSVTTMFSLAFPPGQWFKLGAVHP